MLFPATDPHNKKPPESGGSLMRFVVFSNSGPFRAQEQDEMLAQLIEALVEIPPPMRPGE